MMRFAHSVQYPSRLELEFALSVMLSVREIADALYQGEEPIDAENDNWWGFEAAHIFPLAKENDWRAYNFSRCITITPQTGGPINSVQNGLLLRSDLLQLFDNYA